MFDIGVGIITPLDAALFCVIISVAGFTILGMMFTLMRLIACYKLRKTDKALEDVYHQIQQQALARYLEKKRRKDG